MKTPANLWQQLVNRVEPSTVPDGEIEAVAVRFRNGGVMAKTIEPIPTPEYTEIDEDFDPEEDDIQEYLSKLKEQSEKWEESEEEKPENEEVFVYNELAHRIKELVYERLDKVLDQTPTLGSITLRRCTITEDDINATYKLVDFTQQSEWIREDLKSALSDVDLIDDPSELAYGSIDKAYYNDTGSFKGWEMDGTLYRYTEEPYKYWSEGSDSDYPTNMEEWVEFVSDSEIEKEQVRQRDRHVVHFHPMKHGMEESNALVQWYLSVQEFAEDRYDINEEFVESFVTTKVEIDESSIKVHNSLTL